MDNLTKVVTLALVCLVSQIVQADETQIRQGLAQFPRPIKPDTINPTPIKDLYEVMVGPNVFYITGDGKYVIQGNILDVYAKTDLTELKLAKIRAAKVAEIKDADTVIFAPEQVKHKIYIFTDIDCAYCRKLHSEIDQYMAQGIKIQYLLFPRAGVGSPSYQKAVTVWCSDNKAEALTQAKLGVNLPQKTCDNPVIKTLALGRVLGLSGTPMMVTEKGTIIAGYMPAPDLLVRLNND